MTKARLTDAVPGYLLSISPPEIPPPPPRPPISTPYAHLWISADHVAREKFSASGLATAACKRAWGYRYLIGLKTAEPDHRTYENLNARDRTLAFGKALHARLETYFKGGQVNWTDDIGQRALVGLHLLPQAPPVRVEEQISIHLKNGYEPILFDGYKDLASGDPRDGPNDQIVPLVLYDYKTTGNFRWMKKPDQLRADPAANIYALDEMQRFGTEIQKCRWIYFARNDRPEARPVDFTIDRQAALSVVNGLSLDAANLRQTMREWVSVGDTSIESVDHLPINTSKCSEYGGCSYHFSAGGPCQAEATPGAQLIQIDLSTIHEPKPTQAPDNPAGVDTNMATIAERLASARTANAQPTAAAPLPAAPAAPQFAVTAFAPPPVAVPPPAVDAPPPGWSPFPPVAPPPVSPFAGVAAPIAAAPAQAAPVAPSPPVVPVTAPLTPFAGFGPPPAHVAALVAPPVFAGVNPPVFAGVNPPEQAHAAPLPPEGFPVGAPEVGKKKRGPKSRAAAPVDTSGVEVPTGAGMCEVSITITHENGASLTIPAPVEIAEQFASILGPQLSGMV